MEAACAEALGEVVLVNLSGRGDKDLETVIEETERHGRIPLAGTFVVDPEGVVQYEQVSETPADRTYANFVRHFVREGYEIPYAD